MKTFLTFHKSSPTLAIVILIVLSNLTFGAEEKLTVLDLNKPLRLDFSGSWEKYFRRSKTGAMNSIEKCECAKRPLKDKPLSHRGVMLCNHLSAWAVSIYHEVAAAPQALLN